MSFIPADLRHRSGLRACLGSTTGHGAKAIRPEEPAPDPAPVAAWSQRELLVQQANRQRRYERWEQVRELFLKTGAPDQELARQLGLDHRTVKKFRTAVVYPEAKPRVRESIVDDHASYLDRRLKKAVAVQQDSGVSCANRASADRSTAYATGFGSAAATGPELRAPPERPALRASPRQVVWLILKAAPSAKDMLEEVYRKSPKIGRLAELATSIFRDRSL